VREGNRKSVCGERAFIGTNKGRSPSLLTEGRSHLIALILDTFREDLLELLGALSQLIGSLVNPIGL